MEFLFLLVEVVYTSNFSIFCVIGFVRRTVEKRVNQDDKCKTLHCYTISSIALICCSVWFVGFCSFFSFWFCFFLLLQTIMANLAP